MEAAVAVDEKKEKEKEKEKEETKEKEKDDEEDDEEDENDDGLDGLDGLDEDDEDDEDDSEPTATATATATGSAATAARPSPPPAARVSVALADPKRTLRPPDFVQRVFVLPLAAMRRGSAADARRSPIAAVVTALPHPRTLEPAAFIFLPATTATSSSSSSSSSSPSAVPLVPCEVQVLNTGPVPSCFFVGDSVQQDGSLHLATPVDPLFLLADPLDRARQKTDGREGFFCDVDDVLDEACARCRGYRHLGRPPASALAPVCEMRAAARDGAPPLVRFSDRKFERWLACKVLRLQDALRGAPRDVVVSSAQAAHFAAAADGEDAPPVEPALLLRCALGMVGEYVSDARIAAVARLLGVDAYAPARLTPAERWRALQPRAALVRSAEAAAAAEAGGEGPAGGAGDAGSADDGARRGTKRPAPPPPPPPKSAGVRRLERANKSDRLMTKTQPTLLAFLSRKPGS